MGHILNDRQRFFSNCRKVEIIAEIGKSGLSYRNTRCFTVISYGKSSFILQPADLTNSTRRKEQIFTGEH